MTCPSVWHLAHTFVTLTLDYVCPALFLFRGSDWLKKSSFGGAVGIGQIYNGYSAFVRQGENKDKEEYWVMGPLYIKPLQSSGTQVFDIYWCGMQKELI